MYLAIVPCHGIFLGVAIFKKVLYNAKFSNCNCSFEQCEHDGEFHCSLSPSSLRQKLDALASRPVTPPGSHNLEVPSTYMGQTSLSNGEKKDDNLSIAVPSTAAKLNIVAPWETETDPWKPHGSQVSVSSCWITKAGTLTLWESTEMSTVSRRLLWLASGPQMWGCAPH